MSIGFFETMRGELCDADGGVHEASFEIKADGGSLTELVKTGNSHITGVVHAPPWADFAALEGTLRMSPVVRRTIEYDFTFQNAEWEQFRLTGKKQIDFLHPVHSLTHLAVTLERDGQVVAEGELRFRLEDLPSFARSWGFYGATSHDKTPQTGGTVTDERKALLRALIEGAFPAGERMPSGDETTVEAVLSQLAQAPSHVEAAFWAGLRSLDMLSVLLRRSRFHTLDDTERRAFLSELADSTRGWLTSGLQTHLLIQLLALLPKAAHFARPDYLEAIGHPPQREIGKEDTPRYLRRVVEAEDLGEETELRAHVVVVGTGAGGAAVAHELAKKGLAVAIVEEGRYKQRHNFVGSPLERIHQMYRYQAMNFTLGTPIVIPQGRVVGGTTTVNSGTCFRTPDEVLGEWRCDLGFPDDFRVERYHQWSEEVDQMLQVGPGGKEALGRIAQVIARGSDALGAKHGPLPRNAPGCPGAGECILGCPEGAKRSTDVSYIPSALKSGAELYCGLPVTRILMHGERAIGIEARGRDQNGAPKTLRILADRVVIACGSLSTPLLLRDNGLRLPMLGKNLSVHPGMGLFARMGEDLQPWNAIPQGYGIDAHQDDGIRYEGYYLHPQIMSAMTPFIGDELARWMDDFHQIGQFGFMVRDGGDGFVRRGPGGKPLIGYKLSAESVRRLKKGTAFLARVFLEAGASEVFAGVGPKPLIRSDADARALLDADISPFDFRLLGAHPLGTCRMGRNAKEAVVDFDYRVFGTDNLHVVDGSVVPTSLGVNPQMTIMSFALRAGEVIAERLGAQ